MIVFTHDESSVFHDHMIVCLFHFNDPRNVLHVSQKKNSIKTKSNIFTPIWRAIVM
jgi:hypothetical protein